MVILGLVEYINEYHGGVKSHFASANGMKPQALTKLLNRKKPIKVIIDGNEARLISENRTLKMPKA